MRMGTRSLLFGAHCFWLHPWFVAAAWTKLFGFPKDWRIWLCFFIHDWGYWGKKFMDDEEGEKHPVWAADKVYRLLRWLDDPDPVYWSEFCLYHSRFFAKKDGASPSDLCYADKFAICFMPIWWYVPATILTGEIWQYMDSCSSATYNPWHWFQDLQDYMKGWVYETMLTGVDTQSESREFHSRLTEEFEVAGEQEGYL